MPRRKKHEHKPELELQVKKRGRPKKTAHVENVKNEEVQEIATPVVSRKIVLKKISEEEYLLQRQKEKTMWISVGSVMMAIVIFWVFGIRYSVQHSVAKIDKNAAKVSEIKANLDKQMEQLNKAMETVKAGVKNELASTSVATSSLPTATSSDYNTNIQELSGQVNEILKEATSTVNN